MLRRILLAYDGTPPSERALFVAGHLARVEEGEVILLHVYVPPERYATVDGYEDLLESMERVARRMVEDAARQIKELGVPARGEVVSGEPVAEILTRARQWPADVIVMGARGLTQVRELLLGSVSAQVLRAAEVPVLVVP